ncbi:hypothetical protein TNCV_217441 [Trichonephila clavipes]|nr:hypothetical protein TNCV_217441 [Trichonephila clavipes]
MERKHPSSPLREKFKTIPSAVQVLLTVFWDNQSSCVAGLLEGWDNQCYAVLRQGRLTFQLTLVRNHPMPMLTLSDGYVQQDYTHIEVLS